MNGQDHLQAEQRYQHERSTDTTPEAAHTHVGTGNVK